MERIKNKKRNRCLLRIGILCPDRLQMSEAQLRFGFQDARSSNEALETNLAVPPYFCVSDLHANTKAC